MTKPVNIEYHEQIGLAFNIDNSTSLKTPEIEWTCLVSASLSDEYTALTSSTLQLLNVHGSDLISALFKELLQTEKNHWIFECERHSVQVLSLTLSLVTNDEIAALNQFYREKNKATDVLSFPGVDEANIQTLKIPELDLGEIYISIPWAAEATNQQTAETSFLAPEYKKFVCDRFLHGLLHLLGKHHDTMEAYNWVRKTQDNVLESVF